jgi:hypothetical protein
MPADGAASVWAPRRPISPDAGKQAEQATKLDGEEVLKVRVDVLIRQSERSTVS